MNHTDIETIPIAVGIEQIKIPCICETLINNLHRFSGTFDSDGK